MPKSTITCLDKIELAPKIFLVKFGVDSKLEYTPGQFISMEVAPKEYRSYSLVCCQDELAVNSEYKSQIEFLVNTKSGGSGSQAIEKMEIGDSFSAMGPLGKFNLIENQKAKVFIATGTGLGPFIAMIDLVLKSNPKAEVKLFFGVYSLEYDFTKRFFQDYLDPNKYPNFKIITCADSLEVDEPETDSKTQQTSRYLGKVTEVIKKLITDFDTPDFYICGNPYMVTDMEKSLLENGAKDNVYTEKYGVLTK